MPEAKVAKNGQHFDLRVVGDLHDEVARLSGLGARVLHGTSDLVAMTDPEGNEFCIEN